ncbi:hypothetical protein HY639_01100, partial [Candidatus Woesearchaeota archaeon]|nr:hypothetical protein [Candidatus Woesearchaeota archaeon]
DGHQYCEHQLVTQSSKKELQEGFLPTPCELKNPNRSKLRGFFKRQNELLIAAASCGVWTHFDQSNANRWPQNDSEEAFQRLRTQFLYNLFILILA